MASKLLRRILNNVSDDEVIGIAQTIGLGQPNETSSPTFPQSQQLLIRNDAEKLNEEIVPTNNIQPLNIPSETPSDVPKYSATIPGINLSEEMPSTNTVTRPKTAEELRVEMENLNNQPIQKEEKFFKRLGSGLLRGVTAWAENGGQGGLGGLLGSLGTGGIGSAFSERFEGGLRRNEDKQRLLRQIGDAQKAEEWQTAQDYRNAQTANIYSDNEQKKIDSETKHQQWLESQKEEKRKNWYRRNKFFDPAKATEAQKRELSAFGETPESVGKFDLTNPKVRTVGGVSFQYDPISSEWAETNLPKDGSKALVEYEVTDTATGVKHKYVTTSEKAASLKTSLERAGMMVDAARERQDKQQEFQRTQTQIAQDFDREKRNWEAKQAEIKAARDEATKIRLMEEAEKIKNRIAGLQDELEGN